MQKPEHTPPPEPPYYTRDTTFFTGIFRYFDRKKPVEVRGKAHRSDEPYRLAIGAEQDIRPIPTLKGERTYMHIKPYVLVPDIVLTVGVYPQPKRYADQDPAIGKVVASHEEPHKKEVEIGNAQAWYYHQDRILEIWECYLYDFVRDTPLLTDQNMKSLWTSAEQFLTVQFPHAKQLVTPWHDPTFDNADYEAFLRSRDFQPVAKAAYGKLL